MVIGYCNVVWDACLVILFTYFVMTGLNVAIFTLQNTYLTACVYWLFKNFTDLMFTVMSYTNQASVKSFLIDFFLWHWAETSGHFELFENTVKLLKHRSWAKIRSMVLCAKLLSVYCFSSQQWGWQSCFNARLWQTVKKKKWSLHSSAVHSCTIKEFYSKTFYLLW